MTDCIFCKIVARQVPAHAVFEDEQVLAFLDIHPVRSGHTLIIPKTHYGYFEEMPAELMAHIATLAQRFARHMMTIYNPMRVGVIISGTDVAHMHAHVCPMHEKYDITSGRYITSPNPTFGLPPRAADADLTREAAKLSAVLTVANQNG
jgi:histidine triad (HIT) family protein